MHRLKVLSGMAMILWGTAAAQASDFAGPYLGARAGANVSSATSLNSKTAATGGIEGGYDWDVRGNLLLGLSGYYDDNGKATHTGSGAAPASVNYGSQVYGINLKLGIPADRWLPYAKIGYARVDGMGDNYTSVVNDNALGYGAGLEYKLMPDIGVAAEWDGNMAKHLGTTLDNNNFTLGINYYFGGSEPAPQPVPVAAQTPSQPLPEPQYKTVLSHKPVMLGGANFATGSARLKPTAHPQLDEVVQFAKQYPDTHLLITGYTDNRGSSMMNHALSERRAESVKAYLVDRGVAAERITAQGMGEEHPVADNATAAGRAQNRRVEIRSVVREEHRVRVNP